MSDVTNDMNKAFIRLSLSEAKEQMREELGHWRTKVLLERHMDVVGDHGGGSYFIHWVTYPGLYEQDLYPTMDGYVRADNIDDARTKAIHFLLDHLRENSPKGACLNCGKELPWYFLTRDTIRCPWCGVIEYDWKPLEDE